MTAEPSVLLVDDHWEDVAPLLAGLPAGIRLLTEKVAAKAADRLAKDRTIAAILLDLRFDDQAVQGVEALDLIRDIDPQLPVVVLTSVTDVDLALRLVHAERKAYYYFVKDRVEPPQLTHALENAVSYHQLVVGRWRMTDRGPLVGESPAFLEVLRLVGRVASATLPVLVTGEPGTGKELVARAIHHAGKDPGGPFVAVNCAAIPTELVESELFGTMRGGFTEALDRRGYFEQANNGTVFLDEVGELPPQSQAALLRAVENGEIQPVGGKVRSVRARVIAATNADLEASVNAGTFRADLYYRLNVLRIAVPPLRDRPGDIRLLVDHALSTRYPGKTLSREALSTLERHSWPGNVRELLAAIDQAAVLSDRDELDASAFAARLTDPVGQGLGVGEAWALRILSGTADWAALRREFKGSSATLKGILDATIRRWKQERGDRPSGGELADALGITRNHLNQVLDQLDIRLRSYD